MNDDQLSREISRRASSADTPDMLPAIRSAIDTRPKPATASRLAPLAGLVGVLAALLLLVVTLPGLDPGQRPSSASAASSDLAGHKSPGAVATPDTGSSPQVGPQVIACPPLLESLGDAAPTLIDEAGLVERCLAAAPAGGPPVRNPVSDLSVLEIEWSGSSCHAAATLSLNGTPGGYNVEIAPAAGLCRLLMAPYAVRLELRQPVPATDVYVTYAPAPELGDAWWELASQERPTAESTELDLVVYELACANGESPTDRIVGPEIEFAEEAVTITFWVSPLPGGGDCPLAPGVPVTTHLSEPLGDRRIVDGGVAADAVIEASDSLLALETSRVDEMARERFEAMVGGQQCTSTVEYDRYVPTQAELDAAADIPELRDAGEGFIEFGGYVTDSWLSAARAFGAIEAYGGRPKPWYIVMPGERLTLAQLDPLQISGGRTAWFAGLYQAVLGDPECDPGLGEPPVVQLPIECPSAEGRPAEISIIDHSGLVSSCDAFVGPASSEEFVDVTNVGSDESTLEVRWEIGAVCSSMPIQLELWGPLTYEPAFARPSPFVLEIAEVEPPETPQGCRPAISIQGVRLVLDSQIPADDVLAFRAFGDRGVGQARVGEHTLSVELVAGKLEYEAGEPIDISATILYTGPQNRIMLSALSSNPGFGFQQLDGNMRQSDGGPFICRDLELRRDVPSTVPFRKMGAFIPSDYPDPAAEDAYWSDPEVRLPAGLYRFYVGAGGVIDDTCMSRDRDSIGLARASIVVTVR